VRKTDLQITFQADGEGEFEVGITKLIRDRLVDMGYMCRYMWLFGKAMMYTKLIRMK
jgi:hypothetical protein